MYNRLFIVIRSMQKCILEVNSTKERTLCCVYFLTLKAPNKKGSRRHFNFLLQHQVLFSLKTNDKMFMNVIYCSRDWALRVNSCLSYTVVLENTVQTPDILTG